MSKQLPDLAGKSVVLYITTPVGAPDWFLRDCHINCVIDCYNYLDYKNAVERNFVNWRNRTILLGVKRKHLPPKQMNKIGYKK